MKNLAIIYASKGKSTEEIANSLAFYAQAYGLNVDSINLYKASYIDLNNATNYIANADILALGSPTYDNGKPLPEMETIFNLIGNDFKAKKAMVFGAYGWGKCESVDFLINECNKKNFDVFDKKILDNLIGLRLHTSEIQNDHIICEYFRSFISAKKENVNYNFTNYSIPETNDGRIQSLHIYRRSINAATLNGKEFNNCNFIRVDFSNQIFSNVHFNNCTFWYSKFDNATFNNICFDSCDITNCSIKSVSYERTSLINCDLSESNLYNCDFLDAKFDNVCMKDATFDCASNKPIKPEHVIEKHELSHNYCAAAQIQSQLYNNAKNTDNYELAQLFYYRKMENLRKLYFKQSIIYVIFLKLISIICKFTSSRDEKESSSFFQNVLRNNSTQEVSVHPIKNSLKHFLLVIIKLLTGNTISIIRLLCFTIIAIFISSIVLFMGSYSTDLKNIVSCSSIAINCFRQSLFYTFGLGQVEPISSSIITTIMCYFDGLLSITIEAVFAYILVEKLAR